MNLWNRSSSFPSLSIAALLPWEVQRKEMNSNSDTVAVPRGPTSLKQGQKFGIAPQASVEEHSHTVDKIASSIELLKSQTLLFGTVDFLQVSLFDEEVEDDVEVEERRRDEEDSLMNEDLADDDDDVFANVLTSLRSTDVLKVDDENLRDGDEDDDAYD